MNKHITVEHLIVGAGPTGLGAGYHLQKLGCTDFFLIDQESSPGGLASSFVDDKGFTWDIGGHVQFSHYTYFDQAMQEFLGSEGWLRHDRESWVWLDRRFVPYPFQNNIHRLSPADQEKCFAGLLECALQSRPRKPENFHDWIEANFGRGIADIFLLPYNFKVWAYPPSELNSVWVGERVAVPDVKRIAANIIHRRDDVSWGPNNQFMFPLRGGTGAIWKACALRIDPEKMLLGVGLQSVDIDKNTAMLSNGAVVRFKNLISTIPLDQLLRRTRLTNLLPIAAAGLQRSSSNIIGLGLRGQPGPELKKKCWMYFPEADCPFYRVTVFSNYSPFNVPIPGENWSLMAEVSESPAKPVNHHTLVEDVVRGARDTNLIQDTDEIVSTWVYRAEYGYPTPSLGRDSAINQIIPELEKWNIYSRGRFGLWKYEVSNQDHSFMQGVEVVERLLNGRVEITAFDPNHANSRKHPWPYERWTQ